MKLTKRKNSYMLMFKVLFIKQDNNLKRKENKNKSNKHSKPQKLKLVQLIEYKRKSQLLSDEL